MKKKLIVGILFVSFLLVISIVFAAEKSSKAPVIVNIENPSSCCDCLKKSYGSPYENQDKNNIEKDCHWDCGWWVWNGFDGHWYATWECVWVCNGIPAPRNLQ